MIVQPGALVADAKRARDANDQDNIDHEVLFTNMDRLALAEAARIGLQSPALISPTDPTPDAATMALDICVIEARVRVLEQRVQWVLENQFRNVFDISAFTTEPYPDPAQPQNPATGATGSGTATSGAGGTSSDLG